MKSRPLQFIPALYMFTCATFTISAAAQGTRPSIVDTNRVSQRDLQSREWALMHIPDEVNRHFKKEQFSLFAQIREDFTRMQIVNNELMQNVFVKNLIDDKSIAASAAEICKRAGRLRQNLVLPKAAANDTKQREDESKSTETKSRLIELDHTIMEFVGNPLFKSSKIVDAQLALQARKDLERIITLSDQLKKVSK